MNKIKSVTTFNRDRSLIYYVGQEINGLIISYITDDSLEFESSFTAIYAGYTDKYELVFETINVPVCVEYMGSK